MPSYLETAVGIAREAGEVLLGYFGRVNFELKGEYDLVTAADRASEKLIVERLRASYPDHSILAEEGSGSEISTEYRWYVDPLDGTTNFAHSFPMFNVTLALEQNGQLIAGVIFDPVHDELFTAERGGGAYLNGQPIHVSRATRLEDSLVATGFPSRRRHKNVNIYFYHQLGMQTHGVRRAGAAALDLAYVAAGRLEAFWEFNLNPWDVAAGALIVQEAGGKCSDMKGAPLNLRGPHILADNGLVHEEVLTMFAEVFQGHYRTPLPEMYE